MPIRFRCAYCNQLLGIARRKAGQVVRCPTCAGQVVVPTPEEANVEAANVEAGGPPAPAPPPWGGPPRRPRRPPPLEPAPAPAAVPPAGLVLSPVTATVLTVLAIV